MIYQYNFADGTVLKVIDSGLTLQEIWKLEELHGKCVIGEKVRNKVQMKILIELNKRIYNYAKHHTLTSGEIDEVCDAITNGTPLPKVHGRLIDVDGLVKNIVKEYGVNSIHELPQDIKMFYDKFINSAPTILDATFDYKLKNYAISRKEK